MEPSLSQILAAVQALGPAGLVLVLWWFSERKTEKIVQQYHQDTASILQQYCSDMAEQREMYENNVRLCESYMEISKDLKDLIVLNTAGYTKLKTSIEQNQYCPYVRLKKAASGPEG